MSKPLKEFKNLMLGGKQVEKLWKSHTPGTRIAPSQSGGKDKKWQFRFDAGEVKDGKKKVYLQVNAQASNEALRKWTKKNTTHGKLATAEIDLNTPDDKKEEAFEDLWDDIEEQAKEKLG